MRWKTAMLTIFLLLFLTGCNGLEATYTIRSYSLKADNDTPCEQLITQAVDIHTVMQTFCTHRIYGEGDLTDIHRVIGVECLRENDDGMLYSVHEIKQGGRLYLFYEQFGETDEKPLSRWFYVQKKLAYADFSSIEQGSTMEAVERIDPATQLFDNLYTSHAEEYALSWHYLTDGILELHYTQVDGKYVVHSEEYYPDYEMYQDDESVRKAYDGHILSQDWVA